IPPALLRHIVRQAVVELHDQLAEARPVGPFGAGEQGETVADRLADAEAEAFRGGQPGAAAGAAEGGGERPRHALEPRIALQLMKDRRAEGEAERGSRQRAPLRADLPAHRDVVARDRGAAVERAWRDGDAAGGEDAAEI